MHGYALWYWAEGKVERRHFPACWHSCQMLMPRGRSGKGEIPHTKKIALCWVRVLDVVHVVDRTM